jgi:hypothetical protein
MKSRGTLRSALAALITVLLAGVGLLVPVQTATAADCSFRGTTPVFVEGTLKVGETVKVSPMDWGSGVTLQYVWRDTFVNGIVRQEGPSDTFTIPAAMEDQGLKVQVTGSKTSLSLGPQRPTLPDKLLREACVSVKP